MIMLTARRTNRLLYLLAVFLFCSLGVTAQKAEDAQRIKADDIIGPQVLVPEIKVYLIDEVTRRPYANHDLRVMYYWKWEILVRTPATDRMSNIAELRVPARTDENGVVIIPRRIITPKRPPAPDGAQFSQPEFMYMGIDVANNGISIYDPREDLDCEPEDATCDSLNEVHRTVMAYPRPKKTVKKD